MDALYWSISSICIPAALALSAFWLFFRKPAMRLVGALCDDRVLRIPMIMAFTILGLAQANRFYLLAFDRLPQEISSKPLAMAATSTNLLFIFVLARLTTVRSIPNKSVKGLSPRLYAFWGTFASLLLSVLPPAGIPDAARAISIAMVIVGASLSLFTVSWLGRCFSIFPQSRRLVTEGPYVVVRHPLYVCEEIIVIGIMIDHLSWAAAVIVVGQWYCQLKRIKYEEQVLSETFPEYADYAQRTPALIPFVGR